MTNKSRLVKRQRVIKSALPPGILHPVGDSSESKAHITMFEFDDQHYIETKLDNINDCKDALSRPTIKWIDIDGIHDLKVIEEVGKLFNIHPLTLEDIINTDQRAKFEDYANYTLTIVRKIYYNACVTSEQLSIILLNNVVLTFQEADKQDGFDPIRERIRNKSGRVRRSGADYLAYALLDTIVDTYFSIIEKIGVYIESLEDNIIEENFDKAVIKKIHQTKREMIYLRKSIWPLRELIATMQRIDHPLMAENTNLYFRDVYDHTVRIIETIEAQRELLAELTEIYLSTNSNKMNEVMKVLTIISSLFIPLTFIVGVYGMNFKYMPEIDQPLGYPIVLIIMAILFSGMLIYFRKKKWM